MPMRRRSGKDRIRNLSFEHLEFRRLLVSGPWVLSITPTEVRNAVYDHVDVSFNSDMDAATFSPIDVTLNGPAGSVNVTTVTQLAPASFRLNFVPLTVRGDYSVVIGPNILDLAGNAINQDKDGVNGEATEDQFKASLRLIIADVILSSATNINESNTLYNDKNILIDGTTVAIDGPHNFNSVQIINGGMLTHTANSSSTTHKLDVTTTEQVIVDATSLIDVSGKGYLAGRTSGNTTVGGATGGTGGSYGGQGGRGGTALYGDYADPMDWGAGGSSRPGGGLVRIAAGTVQLDGQIAADGGGGLPAGQGAGGGVFIDAQVLRGAGSIRAHGGTADPSWGSTGGGGGGRIAVHASDLSGFNTSRITAYGGNAESPGGVGTVFLLRSVDAYGTLIIDAGSNSDSGNGLTPLLPSGQTTATIPDEVVIRGSQTRAYTGGIGTTLVFAKPLLIENLSSLVGEGTVRTEGSLTIRTGGLLQASGLLQATTGLSVAGGTLVGAFVRAPSLSLTGGGLVTSQTSTATQMYKLELEISGTLSVGSGSGIDVSIKGYLAGRTSGNTTVGGATGGTGGSYGGQGGQGGTALYGDYADPMDWGAGGSSRAGGGLVRIAAGTVQLDGQIAADGGGGLPAGQGAGGGVFIDAQVLRGAGSIRAHGGTADPSWGSTGGGGGGRIAVHASDLSGFNTSRITAYGGNAESPGGVGTVFLLRPVDPYGTLIIDAGSNSDNGNGLTPLLPSGQTTATIPDEVVIRGSQTRAYTGGIGTTLVFAKPLLIENLGSLVGEGTVRTEGSLTIRTGGLLQASGLLEATTGLSVAGGTLVGAFVRAPSLSLTGGGLVTSQTSTATQMYKLELEISGTLSVGSGSGIDVSSKGYLAGRTSGNTTVGGATGGTGGSYGGQGGQGGTALYGDYADPEDWGAGGGFFRPGGGLVRIVAGTLQLDGQIAADGGGGLQGGQGAGGGISIAVQSLQGTGSIRAHGGTADLSWGGTGGGGGGRIAVYAADVSGFNTSRITAAGGDAVSPGSAGTVYIVQGRLHTHVRSISPAGLNNGFVARPIEFVTLRFNKPIDLSSFAPSDVQITGQMSTLVADGFSQVSERTYRIDIPTLTENGPYHFTLPTTLLDADGFSLDQNANGILGEPADVYSFTLIVDTVAPRITSHAPAGDLAGTIDHVDVSLSEKIDKTTFSAGDISITKPNGQSLALTGIQEVGLNRFRVTFAAQTLVGLYHVTIGPDVRDLAGNKLDQDRDGTFGEALDDVYDANFNLVQVDLGLSNLVVTPSSLWAGEPVSVSWNGSNRSGAALLGSWIDAVYLSSDDKWDINDTRLTIVEHTDGLAAGSTYTGSATIYVPGKLPGNYRILVRADVANQERETNEADNVIASSPLLLDVRPLVADDSAINGSLTTADRSDFYKIVLASGDSLKLKLHSSTSGSQTELYVSYAGLPSRVAFDKRSATPSADQEVSLKAIHGGGVYFVMVHGAQIPVAIPYTITAEKATFFVSQVSPNRHGMAAPAQLTLSGTGFDETTVVDFINSAGVSGRVPSQYVSETELIVKINFAEPPHAFAWAAGIYAVKVMQGANSKTLPNAFEAIAGGTAKLETNLVVPSSVSPGFPIKQTLWVEYRNTGNIAMAAPLLQVSADGNSLLTTDENLANTVQTLRTIPNGLGGSVQLLGVGAGATPGLLQPGEASRLPVYYVGLSKDEGRSQVNFSLGSLSALDTTEKVAYLTGPTERVVFERPATGNRQINPLLGIEPLRVVRSNATRTGLISNTVTGGGGGGVGSVILGPVNVFEEYLMIDWSALRAARPSSTPADAWDAVLYSVRDNFLEGTRGSDLWADYVTRMSQNANYLATVGQRTSSVADLWGFEVAGAAAALNPVRYLAGAVDASVAAPGLPLTFSRVYGQDMASRFRTSTLGRGWTHNWDIRWSASDNGDITLHGPGGVDRFFTKNKNGSYLAAPGDYGQLTLAAGIFTLLETDQTRWQFRDDGGLDFVADTNGNRITLGYTDGLLTSLTHSNGRQLLFAYSGNGASKLLSQVTDTMGPGNADDRVTTYQYDLARQHLLGVVAPGNRQTQYEYAPVTQLPFDVLNSKARLVNLGSYADPRSHALLSVTHVDGTHDYFAYDNHGRLTETKKDANTERVTFTYVSAGGVKVVDATGRETLLNFGLGGQLAQVRDADGRIVEFGYDSKFQFSQLGGPGGEQYRYAYDAKGNLTNIRDALNLQTSFSYESTFNRLAGFTDARGNGIDYRYDTKGNLTRITYDDLTHEDFTYNSVGNVISAMNRRGQMVAYVYNTAGQVTSKDYVTTPAVDFTYQYDIAGNLTRATDAGGTTNMSYELLTDRLTRIEYPGGKFFTFTYDSAGRRTRRTDQDGHIENYAYDSIGRLDRMTDGAGALIVDYDYDAAGRLDRKSLGNGVYTTYLYDKSGNVKNLVNFKPDNSVLSRYDYEYDVSGRRTSMTTLAGRFDYGYDALGQLVGVRYPDSHMVTYDYDEAGNRRQVLDGGTATAYTTNNLNQYTQVGALTYAFDADGNLISQTQNGITTTYAYDIENQLTGVTNPTDSWVYTYDAFGNRVATTHNGQTTRYVMDPTGLGNVAAEYDSSGNLIARYDHGYGLVSRNDATGAAFYTFQAIGHTSELTGVNGAVLNEYAYDPFGVSLGKTETVANAFEYVGEFGVMNEASGFEFMRARAYGPAAGKFLNPDPLGIMGSTNLYAYTHNSPTTRIDASGLSDNVLRKYYDIMDPFVSLLLNERWARADSYLGIALTFWDAYEYYHAIHEAQFPAPWHMPDDAQFTAPEKPVIASDPNYHEEKWTSDPNYQEQKWAKPLEPFKITMPPGWDPLTPYVWPVAIPRSHDPNEKLAPAGYGDAAFVMPDIALDYSLRFENQATATGPAHEIYVTDRLDTSIDLDSFEMTEIAFADQRIAVPAGLSHYETTVAMTAKGTPIQVEVTANVDRATRQFTLLLRAVDPLTGWSPEDPLVGFLYPNDATGRGQGSVSYRVRPKAELATGTEITNRAKIYFDTNDPIDTPQVHNTLDVVGPTSQVAALPSTTTSPTFTVNWSGQDDANGSGIASYDLYGSRDGGIFVPYLSGTALTSMSFTVIPGHTYSFYTVATDNVGHREIEPNAAQASIYIMPLTWHHPVEPLDVNDDGAISPLDALLVINRLNVQPRSTAPLPIPTLALHPAPYLDVTGDNFVTPLDALLVINYLNQRSAGGEGEFERTLVNAGPESEMSGAKPFPTWTTLRLDDPASRIVPSRNDEALLDMLPMTVVSDQPLHLPSTASPRRQESEFSPTASKVVSLKDISTNAIDEGLLQFLASDLHRHKKSWRR